MNTIKEIEKLLTLSLSEASLALLCHLTDRSLTQRRPWLTPGDLSFGPLMDVATDPARVLVPASFSGYYTFPPWAFSCNLKQSNKRVLSCEFPEMQIMLLVLVFGAVITFQTSTRASWDFIRALGAPEHRKAKDVIRSCVYKTTASSRESRLWSKIRGDCEVSRPL